MFSSAGRGWHPLTWWILIPVGVTAGITLTLMSMNTPLIKKINKANGQNSVGLGRDKQAWGGRGGGGGVHACAHASGQGEAGPSLIFSFAQVCLALNHHEWLWPQLWHAPSSLYECARVRVCSKLAPYERSNGSHRASHFIAPLASTCLSFCLKTIKPN